MCSENTIKNHRVTQSLHTIAHFVAAATKEGAALDVQVYQNATIREIGRILEQMEIPYTYQYA